MARVLNIIAQIVHLAKKAKNHLVKGRISSARKLFEIILALEEQELHLIEKESGSQDLMQQCISIYQDTRHAFKEALQFDINNATLLLERIIALEKIQLTDLPKPKKGLTQRVLREIDPYIRELINEINRLSFVKKTDYSCSGHFPYIDGIPYFVIEYDWQTNTGHNAYSFHNSLLKIVAKAGILKPNPANGKVANISTEYNLSECDKIYYYLGFPVSVPWENSPGTLKKQIIKQWNQISILVNRYRDNDSLEYQKQKVLLKNPRLLGSPLFTHQIMVRCPRCGTYMITTDKKPKCRNCHHIIGKIITPLFRR